MCAQTCQAEIAGKKIVIRLAKQIFLPDKSAREIKCIQIMNFSDRFHMIVSCFDFLSEIEAK